MPAALALGFVMGQPVLAAGSHAHDKPAATARLQPDHGRKWSTDDILRRGMSEIRFVMTQALVPVHNGALSPRNMKRADPGSSRAFAVTLGCGRYCGGAGLLVPCMKARISS